ncbi:MAG: alpha/beta fold hydrolase [Anaerolineae bacterium]
MTGVLIVLGVLVLVIAVVPFILPVTPLAGTVPPEQLADPDSRFIKVNGIKLHVKVVGTGEPVYLLLHGFGAYYYSWREVIAPLAAHGTVVVVDRPGYGLTEKVRPTGQGADNPYSVDGQVALFWALLDQLGIERAILVGNSAGGTVALQMTLLHPERVQGLVLVDAAIYTSHGISSWLQPVLASRWAYRIGLYVARSLASRAEQLGQLAWHDPSKQPANYLTEYRKQLQVADWDVGLWESTRAARQLGQEARLSEVTLPTLVLTGDDDRVVPTADSVRLARALPNAELVVIQSCGHLPQEEQPQEFLAALASYVAKIQALNN